MRRAAVGIALLALAGCAFPTHRSGGYYQDDGPPAEAEFDLAKVEEPVPVAEPPSRSGNPRSYEVFGKTYHVMNRAAGYRERGYASWYGKKFHGQKTSSGERYDMYAMTAAHKSLPLPTYVRVRHLRNGRSVVVKVNDRGPFHEGRIIDLSYAAAAKLGMLASGSAMVEVEALTPGANDPAPPASAYLEAGRFDDPITALALREELSGLGVQPVEIRTVSADETEWHRVLVGPFADAEAFEAARRRLEESRLAAEPVGE
ncbi:MAG: septal ring lytic transglycosylase RlpA family protein [Gammaproteobacteria bacterium]|nr:septal ring lytic transglycosylase RlpA family protein [Gammaproteobacteria bacterium]